MSVRRSQRGEELRFRIEYSPHRGTYGVDLVVCSRHLDTPTAYATAITMQAVAMHDAPPDAEPLLRLEQHEAQGLMDELWRAGIRPTNGAGSTGQLAATEKHLADMRALTDKLLDAAIRKRPEAPPDDILQAVIEALPDSILKKMADHK